MIVEKKTVHKMSTKCNRLPFVVSDKDNNQADVSSKAAQTDLFVVFLYWIY